MSAVPVSLTRRRSAHGAPGLKHILGETCGFVPQAHYVSNEAGRMHFGCLPCIGLDVQRIVDRVLGCATASTLDFVKHEATLLGTRLLRCTLCCMQLCGRSLCCLR